MTLEEAKKILEKEGFSVDRFIDMKAYDIKVPSWEKIEVGEAMRVIVENNYMPLMKVSKFKEREARLKKEYGNHIKCGEPLPGSPALKESASQFNDALLDEQAKKIAELTKEKELMKKSTLSQLDDFIEIYNLLTKDSQKAKRLGKEIARLNNIIHDKNAVLSDVAEELRLTKIREKNLAELGLKYVGENEKLKKELEEKTNLLEVVRKGSKEYCEYGIAAEKMIQKMAKVIVGKGFVRSEDYEQYRLWANGYRFNPQLPELSEEEEKKFSSAKDTHPTEDNPEEVTMEEILENVRKALDEGGTVSISYDKAEEGGDQSATIVECGKDIDDVFEEIKRLWQE